MEIVTGGIEQGLQLVMGGRDSTSAYAGSVFFKAALMAERRLGCGQFVVVASGCDTFAMWSKDESLYVLQQDAPEVLTDAINTAEEAGFSRSKRSSFGLLGTSLCLGKREFKTLIKTIGGLACEGSAVCFDYPSDGDGWEMQTDYPYVELETLLEECGFLIYEHLDCDTYRLAYGTETPKGVCYVHAVKKGEYPNAVL